jgi:hypothetical protein
LQIVPAINAKCKWRVKVPGALSWQQSSIE